MFQHTGVRKSIIASLWNPVFPELVDKLFFCPVMLAKFLRERHRSENFLPTGCSFFPWMTLTNVCRRRRNYLTRASLARRETDSRATCCFRPVAVQDDTDEQNIRYHFSRARRVSIYYNYIEGDGRRAKKEAYKTSRGSERKKRGTIGDRGEKGKRRRKRLIARNSRGCCS